MFAAIKPAILLEFYVLKQHIDNKTNNRFYFNRFPKNEILAFTLAEVLITLLIIGIVASLVIPAIINETQDAELKMAWKSDFAIFSQAAKRITADNTTNLSGLFNIVGDDETLTNYFLQYISYNKRCRDGAFITQGCWHAAGKIYKLSGQSFPNSWNYVAGFIMNNGALVRIENLSPTCSFGYAAHDDACGSFYIDVNGFKGPNTFGKDIFGMFLLKNGTLSPFGTKGDHYANSYNDFGCNLNDNDTFGWNCSADYLNN